MPRADLPFGVDNLRFFAAAARNVAGTAAGDFASGCTSMLRREPGGPNRSDRPLELPTVDGDLEGGAGARRRVHDGAQAGTGNAEDGTHARRAGCRARSSAGLLDVMTGGNDTGQALVEHPGLRMISVTGSTGTGKKVDEDGCRRSLK